MKRRGIAVAALCAVLFMGTADLGQAAYVVREGGKTFIVDKVGERWDVTQAESLGFEPEGFQFGIGRDAIVPLDDLLVVAKPGEVPGDLRVIGANEGPVSRAYSVPRLRGHEVANSRLARKAVAAAY